MKKIYETDLWIVGIVKQPISEFIKKPNKKEIISTIESAPPKCELLAPADNAISKIFFLILLENFFIFNISLSFELNLPCLHQLL